MFDMQLQDMSHSTLQVKLLNVLLFAVSYKFKCISGVRLSNSILNNLPKNNT